jgi:hypothetical protein
VNGTTFARSLAQLSPSEPFKWTAPAMRFPAGADRAALARVCSGRATFTAARSAAYFLYIAKKIFTVHWFHKTRVYC